MEMAVKQEVMVEAVEWVESAVVIETVASARSPAAAAVNY